MLKEFWSADEKVYKYSSLHELLLDNEEIIAGNTVNKGMFVNLTPEDIINECVIEDMFYDRFSEFIEDIDGIDLAVEDLKKVMEAIYKMLDNAGVGSYWRPVDGTFEQYTVTEEDLCNGI